MAATTLDAGALIGLERGEPRMQALVDESVSTGAALAVPAGVLAQVWREGGRQARLTRFLALDVVSVVALDELGAKAAGVLCGRAGTADVVDASVVLVARARGGRVVTSDPEHLARLDGGLELFVV